jgi:hypothetical protein
MPVRTGSIDGGHSSQATSNAIYREINNQYVWLREGWIPVPSPPPPALAKAFSRSGRGRNFALFSRVMRVGLSTGPAARRPGSSLSEPIFSGPHDCAVLVNSLLERQQ